MSERESYWLGCLQGQRVEVHTTLWPRAVFGQLLWAEDGSLLLGRDDGRELLIHRNNIVAVTKDNGGDMTGWVL